MSEIRRFREPGPVVQVSSSDKGERDIMATGWHKRFSNSRRYLRSGTFSLCRFYVAEEQGKSDA